MPSTFVNFQDWMGLNQKYGEENRKQLEARKAQLAQQAQAGMQGFTDKENREASQAMDPEVQRGAEYTQAKNTTDAYNQFANQAGTFAGRGALGGAQGQRQGGFESLAMGNTQGLQKRDEGIQGNFDQWLGGYENNVKQTAANSQKIYDDKLAYQNQQRDAQQQQLDALLNAEPEADRGQMQQDINAQLRLNMHKGMTYDEALKQAHTYAKQNQALTKQDEFNQMKYLMTHGMFLAEAQAKAKEYAQQKAAERYKATSRGQNFETANNQDDEQAIANLRYQFMLHGMPVAQADAKARADRAEEKRREALRRGK